MKTESRQSAERSRSKNGNGSGKSSLSNAKIRIGWISTRIFPRELVPVAEMGPGFRRDDSLCWESTRMTELVFRDDAYVRSCAARVTAVDERGIRLDRTVFYPTGGGQ